MQPVRLSPILLALLLLCSANVVYGEDEEKSAVYVGNVGMMTQNGRTWQHLDKQSRIMFLNGMQDGVMLSLKEISGEIDSAKIQRVLLATTVPGFQFSDIVKQVDVFYSDSANIRIPVLEAYMYSLQKMKGATNANLEHLMTQLRQTYNQP